MTIWYHNCINQVYSFSIRSLKSKTEPIVIPNTTLKISRCVIYFRSRFSVLLPACFLLSCLLMPPAINWRNSGNSNKHWCRCWYNRNWLPGQASWWLLRSFPLCCCCYRVIHPAWAVPVNAFTNNIHMLHSLPAAFWYHTCPAVAAVYSAGWAGSSTCYWTASWCSYQ